MVRGQGNNITREEVGIDFADENLKIENCRLQSAHLMMSQMYLRSRLTVQDRNKSLNLELEIRLKRLGESQSERESELEKERQTHRE